MADLRTCICALCMSNILDQLSLVQSTIFAYKYEIGDINSTLHVILFKDVY